MLRFTIREWALLTLIVGLALGWWLDQRRLSHELFLTKVQLASDYLATIGPIQDTVIGYPPSYARHKDE